MAAVNDCTSTTLNTSTEEISECETSDDGLKIDIASPHRKRKTTKKFKSWEIDASDKLIIQDVEKQLEDNLDEKASKANLSAVNVKNILKHVFTNEHVLAMVKQSENPDENAKAAVFEPKLTRAKAKELFPLQPSTSLSWLTSTKTPSSEVQVLIHEELAEDSSGDEYIPAEEESEDDRDSSVFSESEPPSLTQFSPLKSIDSCTQTNWSEDGVFKVPPAKTKETMEEQQEEEANIALRTRSKLSLSATPLEEIEEAFIPPDITTDMYDMDCDDDDWKDFLKKFTRPLDEITKAAEDEDHDPEYNVLADEDIDKMDKEELRADKAVKVSRKELNELMAELFEYADSFSNSLAQNSRSEEPQFTVLEDTTENMNESTVETSNVSYNAQPSKVVDEDSLEHIITSDQKLLLEQQMRQHVQILTQHFIITYQHPEFSNMAINCKEELLNFKLLAEGKENSMFLTSNLNDALKLVEDWENKFLSDSDDVKLAKQHVMKVIHESKQSKAAGTEYIVTFPPLILETISKSNVFIYPSLLPRIPFKSASLTTTKSTFIPQENELIALGLEQFTPFMKQDPYYVTPKGQVKLRSLCHFIVRYMMPMKEVDKLYNYISSSKHRKSVPNAIKYYYENKRAPVTMHYVVSLQQFGVVPPCERDKDMLPYQWRNFLYPPEKQNVIETSVPLESQVTRSNLIKVTKPPAFNRKPRRRILPKSTSPTQSSSLVASTPLRPSVTGYKKQLTITNLSVSPVNNIGSRRNFAASTKGKRLDQYFRSPKRLSFLTLSANLRLQSLRFNSTIFKKLKGRTMSNFVNDGFPSMPSLCTPVKQIPEINNRSPEKGDCSISETGTESLRMTLDDPSNISEVPVIEDDIIVVETEDEEISEKDNADDINALMIASSTIKNLGRRAPSGAEKKKAKLRREYNANLAMLSPEDPVITKEKAQSYAQAYFDKVRERLDPHEYDLFMEILNDFDETMNTVSELYNKVESVLIHKHRDLMDEFLTFLTPAQANDVGKLMPHFMLSNMSLFLRKLEIYFKEQPAQLRKIYHSLTELAACMDVTMDRVKNTILPLLKGNSLLTDWFLQIFPCERPPDSLVNGSWENVDLGRTSNAPEEDKCEVINVPEVEDPYGGPNCICYCHESEDLMLKSRSRHCIPCGTKFLQGRVYIQTGKGLRLANVSFDNSSEVNHKLRLNCRSVVRQKRRSETSPSKQLTSPNKEEEVRGGNESEDDNECGKKRSQRIKSPRKRKPRVSEKHDKTISEQVKMHLSEVLARCSSEPIATSQEAVETSAAVDKQCDMEESEKVNESTENNAENTSDSSINETKVAAEEAMEWDCNTSIESIELRPSPEQSAESESEFCEESSQDNINTESDDSADLESLTNSPAHSDNSNSNTFEDMSWTREEDKIILETFQREGEKDEAFVHISEVLKNRTLSQIKHRFRILMSLLQEMAAGSN